MSWRCNANSWTSTKMAKFDISLGDNLLKQFSYLAEHEQEMLGEMTQAGAKVVENNVRRNMPESLKASNFAKCLKVSKVYKTPSDDAINSKTMFSGYFINEDGKKTPAPLVANVFEYGRSASSKGGSMKAQPFFRKSFVASEIEQAMLQVQAQYIK